MATFLFGVYAHLKSGEVEEVGRLTLTHDEYDWTDAEAVALEHVMAHADEYHYRVDGQQGIVQYGGYIYPLSEFKRLGVQLIAKSID